MSSKKGRFAIDNIIYHKNRGYRLQSDDIDELVSDQSDEKNENAYLYYLKSCSSLSKVQYRKAVLFNKKALGICQNDIGTYEMIRDQFFSISSAIVDLARHDPANLEIGWVYENLGDFGCLGFDQHIFALRHYQTVGETRKEKNLARILTNLYPNHPIIEAVNNKKIEVKKEVRDEKNKDSEKNTAIPRLKAVKKSL